MSDPRDRLVDALLTQHFGEPPIRMESRYSRAFRALDGEAAARERARMRTRAFRWARAALIALFAGVMLLLLPVESSASSVIAQVTNAETRAWARTIERRYEVEVRMRRPAPGGMGEERAITLRGNWDMRGDESRLELEAAGFPSLIRADAAGGAWEQRAGQDAHALESRELWPRWIEDRSGRIAVERMDELMHLVQRAYAVAFARAGNESRTDLRGAMHIVASRLDAARGPDEIDLWIDTERNVVLEARLQWNSEARPPRPPEGPPPARMPEARMPEGRVPEGRPGGPGPNDDYRAAPGALPPFPPSELRLRRVEPVTFPADHFAMPARR